MFHMDCVTSVSFGGSSTQMNRYGLLDETQSKLHYVFALTIENFLEKGLQTLVSKYGMSKSIHHAKIIIRQCHIRSSYELCDLHIDIVLNRSFS
ncbi:hypothetical protein J5N97_012265 [Dioscorea zingiberensis]|uniref:Uncharacterized protein n=1 Tax=Dioscorea zingiberensis TaxID=325984 RepID=A0A9D5CNN3_9LILI|nr:hypothetical protein J5N97_012265 [Dioscorea zingiberensis]